MRFYPNSRAMRIGVTAAWSLVDVAVLVVWLRYHRISWFLDVMLFNSVLAMFTAWTNYWEVGDGAIVQHGLFYRRTIQPDLLRYVGPVRGRSCVGG